MSKRSLTAIFIYVCLGLFLGIPLSTSRTLLSQETMNFSLEGKITQHTGNRLTVNTQGNIVFRVVYSEKTSITRKDGSAGKPEDLSLGTRVFVEGDLTESGEIIAQKITIRPDSSGKKP